jgi:very-short-patch-repair endonuclease
MTRAETLLWRYIKADRVDGASFRRQVPFRNYIADFVCFSAKLVIELDGESHDFAERQARDAERDAFFAAEGFEILRFTNEQVTSNLEGVVEAIRPAPAVRARGLGAPPPDPPPQGGRERRERCKRPRQRARRQPTRS